MAQLHVTSHGELRPGLATALARHATVTPLHPGKPGTGPIVVNGGPPIERDTLTALLDDGRTVVLANPSAGSRVMADGLARMPTANDHSLVVLSRDDERDDRYVVSTIDARDDDSIAATILGIASPRAALLGSMVPGFFPPKGATWGRKRFAIHVPYMSLPAPEDHPSLWSYGAVGGAAAIELYVYWVDGDDQDMHYRVIARVTGKFNAVGGIKLPDAYGFFQHGLRLSFGFNGLGYLPGFMPPDDSSPKTFSSVTGGPVAPVPMQVPMMLMADSQGGRTATPFTADAGPSGSATGSMMMDGWAVRPWSVTGGDLHFHQAAVWNPVERPANTFDSWRDTILDETMKLPDGNWSIRPMTEIANGILEVNAMASWRVPSDATNPKVDPGPKYNPHLNLVVGVRRQIGFVHAPGRCDQNRHYHLQTDELPSGWQWAQVIPINLYDLLKKPLPAQG